MSNLKSVSTTSSLPSVFTLSTSSTPVNDRIIVSDLEKDILRALVKDYPELVNIGTQEDLGLLSSVLVQSEMGDSNIIMKTHFHAESEVVYANTDYDEIQNLSSVIVPSVQKNNVSLGNETAPSYVANLKLEYRDGDHSYVEGAGHKIIFDKNDIDYNLHKASNSRLSNLDPDALNGIVGSFDNEFNANHAFYTESILERSLNNRLVVEPLNILGSDGVGYSNSSSQRNSYGVEILSSNNTNNHPLFGAIKFDQSALGIVVNTDLTESSSLSLLAAATNINNGTSQTTHTTKPPDAITEQEFEGLFTSDKFPKVGPGYNVSIDVGDAQRGGYTIVSPMNNMTTISYNESNDKVSNVSDSKNLFTIDDSDIDENILYMEILKNNNLFAGHNLYVKNGNLSKDSSSQAANDNYSSFVVKDGFESLGVTTSQSAINDLTAPGIIAVIDTNNTLGDANCRWTKGSSGDLSIEGLVVNYKDTESDYIVDVGTLKDKFKDIYNVSCSVTAMTKSTKPQDGLWTSPKDVKMDTNSVLVFQSSPDSPLFSKTNISDYSASGLSAYVPDSSFALLKLVKTLNFEDSNESPMFRTLDNKSLGVATNVSFSELDLNKILAEDIRVSITSKIKDDMPQLTNGWSYAIGDHSETGTILFDDTYQVIPGNSNYLVSSKDGNEYLGTKIYDAMNAYPGAKLTVTFDLETNNSSVVNKDILKRGVKVDMFIQGELTGGVRKPDVLNKTVDNLEMDSNYVKFIDTVDESTTMEEQVTSAQMQALNLKLKNNSQIPSNYTVHKKVTTRSYKVAVRAKVGPYNNLWAVSPVISETTTWRELFNTTKNSVMPDYYLHQIVDGTTGEQYYKASRNFGTTAGGEKVYTKNSVAEFQVKDLMGFRANVQYNSGNNAWNDFTLSNDNSVDAMFDSPTILGISATLGGLNVSGRMTLSIDTPKFTRLGSDLDLGYLINISNAIGSSQFNVTGYTYSVADDSQYLTNFDPYSTDLFLRDVNNNYVSNTIPNLTSTVTLIDPDTATLDNVNKVNEVMVTVKTGTTELFSFVSNKYILENFNIIQFKEPIIKHEYAYGRTLTNLTESTEYLQTRSTSDGGKFYAKLLFGELKMAGIRVLMSREADVSDTGDFKLMGDRVHITPLQDGIENTYSGLYSGVNGTEILPSSTGFPLPTNSTIHRNIHSTIFRGLINGLPSIPLIRTATTVKLVIQGDSQNSIVDDLNVHSDSAISTVYKNRGVGDNPIYQKLEANDLRLSQFNTAALENMSVIMDRVGGTRIGSLGLKFVPEFSMFSESISTTLHKIPIVVTLANYRTVITNPLNTTIVSSIISDVRDVILQEFVPYKLVSTRVKVYQPEHYKLTYNIPNLKVYHSSEYVGNPKDITQWSLIQTLSDSDLRNGVVIGDANFAGVVKFTRNLTNVTSFTKYGILPRPIASLSSYDVADIRTITLPYNLNSLTKKQYYVDINITDLTNATTKQGLIEQNHKPFNKNHLPNVPNPMNNVPSSVGLNNLTLSFKKQKYLEFKESSLASFNFTMTSNKLKISIAPGLINNSYTYYTIFDDYISKLGSNDITGDNTFTSANSSNTFTSGKKWELNFIQPIGPVSSYFTSLPSASGNKNIYLNGIYSHGINEYKLNLPLLDSVSVSFYSIVSELTPNNKFLVTLNRYSTAQGISWVSVLPDNKIFCFKPQLNNNETMQVELDIPNTLTETPFDVISKLHSAIDAVDLSGKMWTPNSTFVSAVSPWGFTSLSTLGLGVLHRILEVTKEKPVKLLTCKRPSLLTYRSVDGGTLCKINHDGRLITNSITTKSLMLTARVLSSSGNIPGIPCEFWRGNVVDSNLFDSF